MAGKIVYGIRAVHEALLAGQQVNRVYVAKQSRSKEIEKILDSARSQSIPFDFVPLAKLNVLTGTGEHQGVAAAISPAEYLTLSDFLASCPKQATVLALDQVQHPKNLGLVIRTALGAGAAAVLLANRGGALLDEAVVRASAGAVLRMPIIRCGNLAQALRRLQKEGFWIYGLDGNAPQSLFSVDWAPRCTLVLGQESEGIRPGVRKACDTLVQIPLENRLDSLNVAVAAGVALFQILSRRGQGPGGKSETASKRGSS